MNNINTIIATNLKKLRTERNLSLGQLSELSNISKVMLSQIEKNDSNPTINTIWKIASGLNVPYTALLEKEKENIQVVKHSDAVTQIDEKKQYQLYCYFPNTPHRNFELFQMELNENCKYESIGHSKKSEEYIMVLKGELTIQISGKTFILNENDTITFDATKKHSYINTGETTLRTMIINFYHI